MIAPWNRREVYTGFKMEEFDKVTRALARGDVEYFYRTVDHARGGGILGGTRHNHVLGSAGLDLDYSLMYYVYVHKDNVDTAQGLIGESLRGY